MKPKMQDTFKAVIKYSEIMEQIMTEIGSCYDYSGAACALDNQKYQYTVDPVVTDAGLSVLNRLYTAYRLHIESLHIN